LGDPACAILILLWTRDQTHLAPAFPTPAHSAPLRGCDFFVFRQKAVLKTKHLHAKKIHKFKKVTTSQGRLFAKNAKERGTHCVGNARKIKSPGHPA
jgi:hypothetical protein